MIHCTYFLIGLLDLFPVGVRRPHYEAGHSLLSSAKLYCAWSLHVRFPVKRKGRFTLAVILRFGLKLDLQLLLLLCFTQSA